MNYIFTLSKKTIEHFFKSYFIAVYFLLTVVTTCLTFDVNAQGVGINSSGNPPNSSAGLDVDFTDRGTLITRLTTAQRDAINSPAEGLQIFNTTTKCFEFYAAGVWQTMICSCTVPSAPAAGTNISSATQIVWNWNTVLGATGYKYSTINAFQNAIDNGTNTSYIQTGLSHCNSYTLYVWAYQSACHSTAATLTQTTCCDGTGGTITHASGNTIHTFTTVGSSTFIPPSCISNVQVLVVGGGGGGGFAGGGAGGVVYNSTYAISSGAHIVTVGNGGLALTNGQNSVFESITAYGGGAGGNNGQAGSGGGSGGGTANNIAGGTGTSGQGKNGGSGSWYGPYTGGGGGGAGTSGGNGSTSGPSIGGVGGNGASYSISGSSAYYGGGGGGAGSQDVAGSAGGLGGGGHSYSGANGSNGTANTGGGGGGTDGGTGGSGGSGIVIISYPTP